MLSTINKILIFGVLILLVFNSCSNPSEQSGQKYDISTYVPLSIGNQWKYRETKYSETGVVLDTNTFVLKVVRDTMINNQKWFITEFSDKIATIYSIQRNANNKLLSWSKIDSEQVVIPYLPVSVDSFQRSIHLPLNGKDSVFTYYIKIDASGEQFTMFNRTFIVYKYYNGYHLFSWRDQTGSVGTEIFATESYLGNFGTVKVVQYGINSYRNPYLMYQQELISYNIN